MVLKVSCVKILMHISASIGKLQHSENLKLLFLSAYNCQFCETRSHLIVVVDNERSHMIGKKLHVLSN